MSNIGHLSLVSVKKLLLILVLSITSVLLFQQAASATNVSSSFINFLTNERGRPASNVQADGLYNQLVSNSFSVCGNSSSYRSQAVNGKDGGESFVSLLNWTSDGAENLNADWRNKSNSLIQLLNGEVGGGMILEYDPTDNREGWCSYIVRMAAQVNIPISAKTVNVTNETETKSVHVSQIGEYCSADFSAASKNILSTRSDIATFLNELNTATYSSVVNKHVNSILQSGAGASACASLVTDLKSQIDAKVAAFCQSNPDAQDCGGVAAATDGATSCAIPGVGWIVCPVVSFLAMIADAAFTFLADNFLRVNTDIVAVGGATYTAWGAMRNIANIAFVIAFLIIIFSQLTGQGIANYGIKKMLPRLVIAAILVNTSFFICQIAVDLSNILGYSIKQFFGGTSQAITDAVNYNATVGDESGNWIGIATAVLAGGAIAWALGISVLLPFLLGAVIALIMIFIILVVRQVLIILLIVLAPIAFVAFLLPNTEQWFTKWRKLFIALLLIFPLIGLLFGAADLASSILKTVYASTDGDNIIGQIIAAAVLVLPLFLLPSLLKGSLNAIPAIGNKLNGIGTKLSKGAQSKAANTGLMKSYAGRKAEQRAAISTGTYAGGNPISRLRSRANRAANSAGWFNAATAGYGADRTLAGQAQQRKDAQEAMAMFGGDDALVEAWAASGGNLDEAKKKFKLEPAQVQQFQLMQNAGHSKKPTSFLAATQYLSENGKSTGAVVQQALDRAKAAGASDIQVGSAGAAAVAAYRKSGRGDALAELSTSTGIKTMSLEEGWGQVAPSSVHREGISSHKDPTTGTVVKSTGLLAYEKHLQSDTEHTRQALVGFDSMEQRARTNAEGSILAAAQLHEYNKTGKTPTISNIREAKDYFGIK